MEQMGFSICCLMCDAPDVAGSERCKGCIQGHTRARDRLTSGKARTKAQRLARELVTMLSDPFSYIDDEIHGESMQYYSEIIREHQQDPDKPTQRRERSQRLSRKTSLIREVANKNRWVDKPPDEGQIEEMREILRDGDASPPLTWDELITEIEDMLDD
jgi:Mg2+ and Co2+ transporter CorA